MAKTIIENASSIRRNRYLKQRLLNQKKLKELVSYDPETGNFFWKKPKRKCFIGKQIPHSPSHTYMFFRLLGKGYYAHRLVWLYVYGEWPKGFLDHIDGNPKNNRISNLRNATLVQNGANCKKKNGRETTKYKGISFSKRWAKKPWMARIAVSNKNIYLGNFETEEEAANAYCEAAEKYNKEFAFHLSRPNAQP